MRAFFFLLCFVNSCLQAIAENYPYRSDYLWLTVPNHADWLYKVGENAKVEVTFCRYGIPQDTEVCYEIGPDEMPATSSGKVKLKNGRAVIDMGTMKEPGFLDLRLKATIGGKQTEHHVKIGFSPEQLKPYTKNPNDFGQFWKQAIETARQTPVSVTREPLTKFSDNEVECQLVKIRIDKHHSVYGYLTKPRKGR